MKARLQEASDAHQAFLTKQVQDNQESSVKDIMNRMNLGTVADPVNNGAIQQPTTSTQVASQMAGPSVQQGVTGGSSINDPMSVTQSPGPSGGPSALPPMQATVPGGAIPVDPSRQQVTYNGRGGSQQYALKTSQQLQTQADLQDLHNRMNKAADSYSTAAAEGQAKNDLQLQGLKNAHAYQLQEEGGGTPAPPEFSAFGYQAGTPLTRAELAGGRKALDDQQTNAAKLQKEGQVILGKDQNLFQMPTPGAPGVPQAAPAPSSAPVPGGQPTQAPGANGAANSQAPAMTLLASGPPEDNPQKSFIAKFLLNAGKTPQTATINDLVPAYQAYATATKDPATLELAHALTSARLAQMQDQHNAANGQTPEIEPGTPQYKVAQDMAYGKLTMQQFRSLYSYSRNIGARSEEHTTELQSLS